MTRAWWINQGQSSRLGHGYGVVWAPLVNDVGTAVWHWDTMDAARAGDIAIHYANGAIRGFSAVLAPARPETRPYEGRPWNDQGRTLDVDYVPLDVPVELDALPIARRLTASDQRSPFDKNGRVNQGYFYELSIDAACDFLAIAGARIEVTGDDSETPFKIDGLSDREGLAKYRREQPLIRRRLLAGRAEAACGLCSVMTPAPYLVAAHIKPRAQCSERERRDPSVAMLACLLGCDAAFERGDLTVKDDGHISVTRAASTVSDRLRHLDGKSAPAFSDKSRRFFRFHRAASR